MSRYQELLSEFEALPHGPSALQTAEELVLEADAHQGLKEQWEARQKLMDGANHANAVDRLILAFSWCLGQADTHPQEFEVDDILWQYKWVLERAWTIPSISRTKVESMFADAKARYQTHGYSLRPLLDQEAAWLLHRGAPTEAAETFEKGRSLPRDWMADCHACEVSNRSEIAYQLGNPQDCVDHAEEAIRHELSCAEEPERIHSRSLVALHLLGKTELARERQRRYYPDLVDNPLYLSSVNRHIAFLTLDQQWDAAEKVYQKHRSWAHDSADQQEAFRFHLVTSNLLVSLQNAGRAISADHLESAFTNAQRIATAFDARNGSSRFQDLLAD